MDPIVKDSLDDPTPADVGRRLVEIHVGLGRLGAEREALELEAARLKALLTTALPAGEAKLLLVESYRDGTGERRDPHLVELFTEEGQAYVEILAIDRWSDLAWPEADPEIGSNAALIAASNGFHPGTDRDLIDSETS
jgi:hypothetical protein